MSNPQWMEMESSHPNSAENSESINFLLPEQALLRQQKALCAISERGVAVGELQPFLDFVVETVAQALGLEVCRILEQTDENPHPLQLRALYDSTGSHYSRMFNPATENQALYALEMKQRVVMDDCTGEKRFQPSALYTWQGMRSAVTTIIPCKGSIYGVLEVGSYPQRHFHAHHLQFLDAVAQLVGMVLNHIKAEDAVSDKLARYKEWVEGSGYGGWGVNLETNERFWSEQFYQMLGLSSQAFELDPNTLPDLVHPDDRERVYQMLTSHSETGEPYDIELRMRHASGHYLHVFSQVTFPRDEDGKIRRVVGMTIDITERKRQEALLMESEERFRAISDNAPFMIWMTDTVGMPIYFNRLWHEFSGYNAISDIDWDTFIYPEDFKATSDRFVQAISQRLPYSDEIRIRRHDGMYRWFLAVANPRYSNSDEFIGYVGCYIDIHDRKLAETALQGRELALKIYSNRLKRSNEELEQFATVASHDLQEPLRKLLLFSNFLQETAGEQLPPDCYDYLNRMRNAVIRMQSLIDDLLVLSRVSRKEKIFQVVHLGNVLQGVLSDLEPYCAEQQGTIQVGTMLSIEADDVQMRQLLQNLLQNALKFHKPNVSPQVLVDCALVRLDSPTGSAKEREYCELTITDNGIGFDEKYLDRIFTMFERLHGGRDYEGTGIGLAIVHKIVDRHDGWITANSTPGSGAVFKVYLPVQQQIAKQDN